MMLQIVNKMLLKLPNEGAPHSKKDHLTENCMKFACDFVCYLTLLNDFKRFIFKNFMSNYSLLRWYSLSFFDEFWKIWRRLTELHAIHRATSRIFCALQHCWKCLSEGWKRLFFKKLCFFIFSNFSNFIYSSDFCQKSVKENVEWHFQEKIPFVTLSRKNLPHVAILEKFKVFSKNPSIF